MSLPDDYIRYPHRRRGMDHDRYEWSMLPRRDKVTWPDGKRVALWVCPALEWFPLDMGNKPFLAPGGLARPYPDYWNYTHRDYGNRVGIFRIFDVLDRLGIRASATMNAAVAERHPVLVEEVKKRDWEIIAGGVHMGLVHHTGLDVEEERALIRQALGTLRGASGQPVTGWLSPGKAESLNTPDLVAAEGVEYLCDWVNDDLPYPLRTESGSLHSMPHAHELDDRFIMVQLLHTPADFEQQLRDQFDLLYRESETEGGRIMAITLHPWVIGQPFRIKALERALTHIMAHDGVWPATGAEILAAFKGQA